MSYVVSPVITSKPLRLPYALNSYLAGFTQLDICLPQVESCRDAGISGPTSVIFHRMPMAIPRVPCRCSCPLLPCKLWPSPIIERIGVYPQYRVYPFTELSQLYPSDQISRGCTIRFMLRPAVLAGPPDWVGHAHCMPSRDRVGASSARVLPHEPALCLLIQKGN